MVQAISGRVNVGWLVWGSSQDSSVTVDVKGHSETNSVEQWSIQPFSTEVRAGL